MEKKFNIVVGEDGTVKLPDAVLEKLMFSQSPPCRRAFTRFSSAAIVIAVCG